MKVAVLSGGRSSEHDVSLASGQAVGTIVSRQVKAILANQRDGARKGR